MPRTTAVDPATATGDLKQMFDQMEKGLGMVPNIFKGMAANPVILNAYFALDKSLAESTLTPRQREVVRMTTSVVNDCGYCQAAHTAISKGLKLEDDYIIAIRRGQVDDPQDQALITLTRRLIETKGFVANDELSAFQQAGFTEANITDVITIIAQKTLTNLFNHVHETEIDFPEIPSLSATPAGA